MSDISYERYHRDSDYEKFEKLFDNIFQKRFNILKGFIPETGSVLDVGSSTGIFLQIFKKYGWDVTGVEPSQSSNKAKKRNIKVIQTYFEKVNFTKLKFDLVLMNHTLEHMDNPYVVLNRAHSVLKKNGILFIDVPNAGGLGARLLGKNWPYLLPQEHKHQFTKKSLAKIINENGFKVLHWESRSGLFEYANPLLELSRSLLSLKKRFFIDLLFFPYSIIATLFNQGDSMSFVAKKV